jgi:N-acetylneuraminic acid mutarotase
LLIFGGSSHPRKRSARANGASSSRRGSGAVNVVVSSVGQLPAAVQDAAAAPLPGAALLVGGLDSGETSVGDVVQIQAGVATTVGALPIAVHDACASTADGAVYVFGGGQQVSFSQILKVTPAGRVEQAGSLPTPASDVACTTIAGVVYIVGGYTGQEPLRTILAWRPGEQPRIVGTLPKPLRYAAIGPMGGDLLIAGGTSGVQASRDVYRFSPVSRTVRLFARLPFPVTHAAGASLGAAMLVIGGRGEATGSQKRSILAISPAGSVTVAGALPLALSDLAAVQDGQTLILAGGADRAGLTHREILAIALKH